MTWVWGHDPVVLRPSKCLPVFFQSNPAGTVSLASIDLAIRVLAMVIRSIAPRSGSLAGVGRSNSAGRPRRIWCMRVGTGRDVEAEHRMATRAEPGRNETAKPA